MIWQKSKIDSVYLTTSKGSKAMDKQIARMAMVLAQDLAVGRTALNKLLFFADIACFVQSRGKRKISNSDYVKMSYGPVPENMDEVRKYLVENGLFHTSLELNGGYIQHSYRAADLSEEDRKKIERPLEKGDLKLLRKVKKAFGCMLAIELSQLSHRYEPWKSADFFGALNFDKALEDPSLADLLRRKRILPPRAQAGKA